MSPLFRMRNSLCFVFLLVLLAGCGNEDKANYVPQFGAEPQSISKEYIFAIHPLHNPKLLFQIYSPLIDYLNEHIRDAHFRFEASRNYAEFERKLYSRRFDFALPNPYQTLNSLKYGYRIFGKMGDDDDFRGIILVRRDSGIVNVADLKGKKMSFPARTALAATMMPQYYLATHGLDIRHDIKALYVGSQESSIMNVYLGNVAAGATWPPPWKSFVIDHPAIAKQLVVRWRTFSLPDNGLVVRDDVPESLKNRVAALLFNLQNTEKGRIILARMPLSRFVQADESTYRPVREFLHQYSAALKVPAP